MLIHFLPGDWFVPAGLAKKVSGNLRNQQPFQGIRTVLNLKSDVTLPLRRWTWWTSRRARYVHEQLNSPHDENFPILKKPLPMPCLYRIGPCPVLLHPATGIVFGLRIGDCLRLLRLPEPMRERAIAANAVWPRSPLPNLKELEIQKLFGVDWVVPNTLHSMSHELYCSAYDHGGQID